MEIGSEQMRRIDSEYCSWAMYRPRGALARALYNKHISDLCLDEFDRSQWYTVDKKQLSKEANELYVEMACDEETDAFLERSTELSNSIFTQIFHSVVKFILGFFMTQTSINGLLGRGSMFVFSSRQFGELTGRKMGESGDLVDLGAGDGATTQVMASYFTNVSVTEVSRPMKKTLALRGFQVLDCDDWMKESKYDLVSCLNVLDRCDEPLTLLENIRETLRPGAKAVVAVVLPFKPYVETGKRWDHKPTQTLSVEGKTFEAQVNNLIAKVFIPQGFVVSAWTRLPYLCQGDLHQSYYWLDDAVFVLELPQES